jgi:hypothetical protein
MTPVERAARAAYASDWREPHHASWEEAASDMRDRYTSIAVAVVASIREPSDDQLIEAQRAMFDATQSAPPSSAIATGYKAMIDELIKVEWK